MPSLNEIPRLPLAFLPTPLHDAPALTRFLGGPRILFKRDDQTGLAIGGNKARKLEFLLAAARRVGASTLLTTGAADSNHCRMTAAAAAQNGFRCVLLLGAKSEAPSVQGNLLLDRLFGAETQFYPAGGSLNGNALLPEVAAALRERGENVFAFPSGGSTGLGALGYALAVRELMDQLEAQGVRADYVVHASGSGGTHAGLLLGKALFNAPFEILAINIDEAENAALEARTRSVYAEGVELMGNGLAMPPFHLIAGYVGDGYGIMSREGAEAIAETAHREGILLDPVYTGKAMAGLFDLVRSGRIRAGETVVFLHTGGTPALFTQADAVAQSASPAPAAPTWWGRPS